MRVVKCSLTNSALRPVSGWVRTTGCTAGATWSICACDSLGRHGFFARSSSYFAR